MELKTMIVTETVPSIGGTSSPYDFYAHIVSATDDPAHSHIVQIVMPLGGLESGLFRYPKPGEKVLVGIDGTVTDDVIASDSACYLMGYLPSTTGQPFSPAKNNADSTQSTVIDKQGQVFRYKKTGTNPPDEMKYSEIGFYNKETSWKSSGSASFPQIDRINIQSTGDIYSDAQNYHEIKAKRLELLVNEKANHAEETQEAENDKDKAGDMLLAGDMRVKAKNRITIEAGDEIEIKVGRSSIVISDSGIEMVSSKGSGIGSPWDTSLSLDSRAGISMFGQTVNISAVYNFSIGESYGSSISGNSSMLGISAKKIQLETLTKPIGIAYSIQCATDLLMSVGTVSAAHHINRKELTGTDTAEDAEKALPAFQNVIGTVKDIAAAAVKPPDNEGLDLVVCIFDLILSLCRLTFTCIDKYAIKKASDRDALNLSALIIEYGYATVVNSYMLYVAPLKGIMNATGSEDYIHYASITLDHGSQISGESVGKQFLGADQKNTLGALAGLEKSSMVLGIITPIVSMIGGMIDAYAEDPEIEAELKEL